MFDKINEDLKISLKNGDKFRLSVMRMLKSALQLEAINKKGNLTDDDVITVIKRQVKQRNESIKEYESLGKNDTANDLKKEVEILSSYLPEEASVEQINDINYLKENYRGYGTGLKCAKALNRPLKLVNEKAKQLGLSICCPNWTSDELEILKKYYPIEGTKVYLRLPKHSEAACRAQATKLKIKVQTHYWSKDDIKKFEDNADKPLTEITKLFPNRTYASIKHYWQRYIKEKIKNGKNNDRRKN